MDNTPQDGTTTQAISDDQELAQALAGVLPVEDAPMDPALTPDSPSATGASAPSLTPADPNAPAVTASAITGTTPTLDSTDPLATQLPPAPTITPEPSATSATQAPTTLPGLEDIKNSALNSLRPLIGKVELPAEEKFDTYLMLIRSTDDASLIEPAHAAAQAIEDEKRKAEALLEIIKEIDYLSRKGQ